MPSQRFVGLAVFVLVVAVLSSGCRHTPGNRARSNAVLDVQRKHRRAANCSERYVSVREIQYRNYHGDFIAYGCGVEGTYHCKYDRCRLQGNLRPMLPDRSIARTPSVAEPPAAPPSEVVDECATEVPGGVETPSRQSVAACLGRLWGGIRACADEGTVSLHFIFDSSGIATSVTVQPATEEGSQTTTTDLAVIACVEGAARGARIPTFRRPTFNVWYPYSLGQP
jgi:hypothetical protein